MKSEGAEAIARFVFIQFTLKWVKRKNVDISIFHVWIITVISLGTLT